jgi:hypothetical protein
MAAVNKMPQRQRKKITLALSPGHRHFARCACLLRDDIYNERMMLMIRDRSTKH